MAYIAEAKGKISFTQGSDSVIFDRTKFKISVEKVVNSYKNIFGKIIEIKKGYRINADITLYMIKQGFAESLADLEKMKKLINMINVLDKDHLITLNIYGLNDTIKSSFTFDSQKGKMEYSKYFSNNSNLGLEFPLELSNNKLLSTFPTIWS